MAWIIISQQLHYCDDDDNDDDDGGGGGGGGDDDDDDNDDDADDKNDINNDGHHLRTTHTHSWGAPHQNIRHEQHSLLQQVTPFPGFWSCAVCGTNNT